MPTYDYQCPQCGPFDALRRMAERDVPADCPRCERPSVRAWLAAPRLADMPAERRFALATNERAQHEPKESARYRHPAGCGCCAGPKRSGEVAMAPRSFAGKRPWMISH
jgi:putative FmdB family regulatory protein